MGNPVPTTNRKPTYTLERQQIGPVTHLRVCGAIDETFKGARQAESLVGHVLIDLGRIGRISSFGVRQFMEMTSRLPLGAFGLYLMNLPPVLVDQLNMVEGFAGLAQVLSVLAPYACEKCGDERVRVIDARAHGLMLAQGNVPEFTCPTCSTPMRFAEPVSEYFSYFTQHPVQGLDPVIERYLAFLGQPQAADQLKPVKIVHENVTYVRMSSTVRTDLSTRALTSGIEGLVVYDFASVAQVDPGAEKKLLTVMEQASKDATVVLWRLPPVVVSALSGQEGLPASVAVASLWLPCECRGCGSSLPQAIPAAEYLRRVAGAAAEKRICGVCGAPVEVPHLEGAAKLLTDHPANEVPYLMIYEVEPKAASQLLHFSSHSDVTPNTPAGDALTVAAPKREGEAAGAKRDDDNLQLLKHLGRGGMAEVFLARKVGLQGVEKYVVVKRVLPSLAESGDFVDMLFSEARANARLTHPNVVQIFDVGSMAGTAHLTMEYVRGPDLKRVLLMARKAGTSLPVPIALRIIAETAAGLHYAHTFVDPLGNPHPVIHRDVSPHNILLSLDGAVKLSDFGIAKVNDGGEGTRPGTFKGKIHYSSPEQIRGLPLDARHDLFSLGIVLFETVTGFLPFKGENDVATLTAIAQSPTPDPRQALPSLPDDVVELMLRTLSKSPDDRFASAGELREAIEEAMVRNKYRASPTDVARYVRDILGERLVDYTPQGLTNPGATTGPQSSPSLRALTPSGGTPGFRPMATNPPLGQSSMPPTVSLARPRGVPTGLTPAPGSVLTPRPSASGHTPVPGSGTTPRPSASGHTPAPGSGTTPRPSATGHTPLPVPPPPGAPVPLSPSGPLGAAHGLVAAPLAAGSEAKRPRRFTALIAVAVGVPLCALAAVSVLALAGGPAVEISNLKPGEALFVDGVEVNPATLQPRADPAPVPVAIAAGGVLKRMGTASVSTVLDLQPLFEATPGEGQTGDLKVTTREPGCAVELDGTALAGPTPVTTTIPAGKVLDLRVTCAGQPAEAHRILAVPGQHIVVSSEGVAGPTP